MKSNLVHFCLASLLLQGLLLAPAAWGKAPEITISCGAVGIELRLCKQSAQAWAKKTGNRVRVVSTPNSTTQRLALYQQLLAGQTKDIDVYQIDVIWPGLLSNQFINLRRYSKGAEKADFPAIVANDTVDGRLVAMPLYADVGLLYYRKDLLKRYGHAVPKTWQQMTKTAAAIQSAEHAAGDKKMWGFVFQGRAYEGLTCDALEWLTAFRGGTFINQQGRITVDNPQAVKALRMASGWVGKISPEGVLNYAEEESRGVFQAGQAVFMRNWPYAWALLNGPDSTVKGKVGVVAVPGAEPGKPGHGTLGGWQLAVSKYSRHPALAASLVMFMTGASQQKRRAIVGGYNPTIPALYHDPDILRAQPFIGRLETLVAHAVARPSRVTKSEYNRVSAEIANEFHAALSGRSKPAAALRHLANELRRIKRRGWR